MMKRLLDILASSFALLLLSPALLILAILVRWKIGSPVLFLQTRPGLQGKPFKMIKFRSMNDATGPDGNLLPDVQRLTPFGRWLRSTSLDELPGIWNVLKGNMSLVGPRPLLMQYLPLYNEHQLRRHEVLPGITGWAQINGRNAVEWAERLEMDVWYVDNRSLLLDFRILALTVFKVVRREGIQASDDATMPAFQGTPPTHDPESSRSQGVRGPA